jgi:hypothetical protein
VKLPRAEPSVVLESLVVGFDDVDQQIPLAVTAPPPSLVIFPPEVPDVSPIELTDVVAIVGATTAVVVNVTSFPYAVPTPFIA